MAEKKVKDIFIRGAIEPGFISSSLQSHQQKTSIGGHSIFLGQVRADVIENKQVAAIEYTSYEELALQKMAVIRDEIISKYELTCMHVHHSLGHILAGQICLFVFTSSPHRAAAINACNETVERIKAELPIWGKEIFHDDSYQWKQNI